MSCERVESLLRNCTHCGLCREVCIVESLGAHSITSFLSGEEEYSSWLCSSCWRCQEVCPQGVDIHAVMMEKRREEKPPAGHQANLVNVLRFGYALPMDERVNELRRAHGLEAVQFIPAEQLEILLQGDLVGPQEDR
jgi:heterodisulfide reductase subunit C